MISAILFPIYGLLSYLLGMGVGFWGCYVILYRPLRVLTTPNKPKVSDLRPR